MRSFWFGVLVCAAMFVACSDDDSDFATRPSDVSSSSVCEDCDDGSSSSSRTKSSSSSAESSSSAKSSSSSAKSSSSSRIGCKTETEENCEYGELVDDRDGQTYKTVKIGSQWWMAENLNYQVDSSFCNNDSAEYCEKYGRFYRWAAAVGKSESECGYDSTCSLPSGNIQGVCPSGWHLPSKTEWRTLFDAVGGQSMACEVLKSTFEWNDYYEGKSGNGTDAFGFSALPSGQRGNDGNYYGEGNYACFWSSTEVNSGSAYRIDLFYNHAHAGLGNDNKYHAFSVRCVKD